MAKNLAELCSTVFWKVASMKDKSRYLAKEISKQSTEGTAGLVPPDCLLQNTVRERSIEEANF